MSLRNGARWELNTEALQRLIARLDPDAQRAGEKYEELRRTLLKFFEWRGAPAPEDGADEVLDRLARKFEQDEQIADLRAYAYGIARLIVLEQSRSPQLRQVPLETISNLAAVPQTAESPLVERLERCLAELPLESRSLILRYYADERRSRIDGRRQLARELGVRPEALRNRAQRLRDRLEECVVCREVLTAQPSSRKTNA